MAFNKKKKSLPIFLAIAGIFVFLHYTGITRPLENFFIFLAKPLSERFYNASSSVNKTYKNSQESEENINEKLKNLEAEVAKLMVLKADYQEVIDENTKLKGLIDFSDSGDFDIVAASVIAKENIDKDNRDLVINRGIKDGLSEGLAVTNEHGVLIGKIIEVKDSVSKICLSVNPECSFAASIQNQNKTQGIVAGNLSLTIKMSFIPQLEKIAVNDIVITSGLGGKVPRGLVIGEISEVKSETNEVWQEAIIDPPVDFENLTVVSVVKP